MKKIFTLLLATIMAFSFTACGNNTASVDVADATELLTKVWDSYTEEETFVIMGGDYEHIVDNAPGAYAYENAEEYGMEYALCFPLSAVDYIDDAASMTHGMMANDFTAGAYHVTDAANVETVTDGIKETTLNTQWMCSIPEKLIVITVGDNYVISAFGKNTLIDTFKDKIVETYGDAVVIAVEEPLE